MSQSLELNSAIKENDYYGIKSLLEQGEALDFSGVSDLSDKLHKINSILLKTAVASGLIEPLKQMNRSSAGGLQSGALSEGERAALFVRGAQYGQLNVLAYLIEFGDLSRRWFESNGVKWLRVAIRQWMSAHSGESKVEQKDAIALLRAVAHQGHLSAASYLMDSLLISKEMLPQQAKEILKGTIYNGHFAVFKALLAVDRIFQEQFAKMGKGHLLSRVIKEGYGDFEVFLIEDIFKAGGQEPIAKQALFSAASHGRLDIIRVFEEYFIALDDPRDQWDIVLSAVSNNHLEVVQYLLTLKPSDGSPVIIPSIWRLFLEASVKQGHFSMVEWLVEQADLDCLSLEIIKDSAELARSHQHSKLSNYLEGRISRLEPQAAGAKADSPKTVVDAPFSPPPRSGSSPVLFKAASSGLAQGLSSADNALLGAFLGAKAQ